MDFKERVCNELIICAAIYKSIFIDYDYLIYSSDFTKESYYIISAYEENYAHLTGVHSLISARDFYLRCLNGTLRESDFDFIDMHKDEKSVKGTVRRKLKSLAELPNLFSQNLKAEECFSKGRVYCVIATANNQITIGFVKTENILPKTLLKGNCLNQTKAVDVSLVLRRNRCSDKFDTIIQGDIETFCPLFPDIYLCEYL